MFSGLLRERQEQEKCSYLILWIGEKGQDVCTTWTLEEDEAKKLHMYYDRIPYIKVQPNICQIPFSHENTSEQWIIWTFCNRTVATLTATRRSTRLHSICHKLSTSAWNVPQPGCRTNKAVHIALSHELAQMQLKEMVCSRGFKETKNVISVEAHTAWKMSVQLKESNALSAKSLTTLQRHAK